MGFWLPACAGGGAEAAQRNSGEDSYGACFSFSSTGLVGEKPAHSGTFPSHRAVCKKPGSLPLLVTPKGSGGKEAKVGCGPNGQGWLWRLLCAISSQRAGSCRGGTVTVAANRRGSGSVEGLSDTLPDIQEPFSLLHQGKAADNTAGLTAQKTDGPRSKTDYCWWPSRLRSLVFTAQ